MIGNATTLSKWLSSTRSIMTCLYYRSRNSQGTLRANSPPPPACPPYPRALIQTLPTPAHPQMRESPPLVKEVMGRQSRPSCSGSRDALESKRDFSDHWEYFLISCARFRTSCWFKALLATLFFQIWSCCTGLWKELDKWSGFSCCDKVHWPQSGGYEEGSAPNTQREHWGSI